MHNLATSRVILTSDVKWNGFYGANVANEPTLFDFTDGTEKKTTSRENKRNQKENDNKLYLWKKEVPPPVHEYKFIEIEDDENIGGNAKQIKKQNETVKQPLILHIPT